MNRDRLKAVLAGGSSITFDARPREVAQGDGDANAGEGFFQTRLLRNVMLVKLVQVLDDDPSRVAKLQTLIYFPFDPHAMGNGGRSIIFTGERFRVAIERNFGVELAEGKFAADLAKLEVFARAPSFSPFLLRDAFERAHIKVNSDFFAISDEDADIARDRLKTKLKPLAALALDRSVDLVGGGQLELLVRKLWQLDDTGFLFPLSRALQIPDGDAVAVFYSWIGVSYLQSEFVAREARVRSLAQWLAIKSMPVEILRAGDMREYQAGRQFVREKLRTAWMAASDVFVRLDTSYRSLISAGGDPRPFVELLRTVRADFTLLGVCASTIDQCLSVFDYWTSRLSSDRVTFDDLRKIVGSMSEVWADADRGQAPALEPTKIAV